jgi:catecholate siderophore receptor
MSLPDSARPATESSPRPAGTSLRSGPSLLTKGVIAAAMTLVNSMLPGNRAQAQTATAPATSGTNAALPEVVIAGGGGGYNATTLSSSKGTGLLLTTPQAVQVITPQLRQDQNDESLRDSLRNVSGLALGAGEGSYQGDNFTIRGFNAATDIFVDGMQDFGNYYRDPFNIENIEVLKGPSAVEFGRGSTAGAINMVTKTPELESFVAGSTVYGTDETHRGTLDVNEPIPWLQGSAFRLNVMGDQSEVTNRNDVDYNRWGFAPSLAFGLDTPTRIILNYFHQEEDDNPDYGIPWVNDRPAPVGRDAFYGFTDDYLKARVNEGTLIIEHDFNDNLTLHEQLRLSDAHRDLRVTQGQLDDEDTPPGESLDDLDVERVEIDGISDERDVDNDVNLQWKGSKGPFDNQVVLGFEYLHQSADPRRSEPSWTGVPSTSLLHPDQGDLFTGFGYTSIIVNGHADTYSEYLTDTLKIGNPWTVIGSLRYDSIASLYNESLPPATNFTANNARLDWRAALVYQPAPNGSIYAAAGTSYHPNVQQQSLINEPTLPESFKDLPVGENTDYEVGTKWDLFTERLSVGADLFWDDQKNPAAEDADDDLLYVTNGKERDIGIELDAAGHITAPWQVYASFTYQRGVVTASNPSSLVGKPILNTPRCTFSIWTTYDLPWNLEAGFGVDGVGARAGSETPDPVNGLIMEGPGYVLLSAMLKYQINSRVDIQANVTNLLDQAYDESIHPGHVVPGEGRTLYISTNFKF